MDHSVDLVRQERPSLHLEKLQHWARHRQSGHLLVVAVRPGCPDSGFGQFNSVHIQCIPCARNCPRLGGDAEINKVKPFQVACRTYTKVSKL